MSDEEYESVRQSAYLQFFRVAAIFGAIVGSILPALMGLLVASLAGYLTPGEITVSAAGTDLPLVFLGQAAFTIEVLRKIAILTLHGEPELRKVEK